MQTRDPLDVPFLVFVMVVTILLVAFGYVVYPR